MKDGAGFFLARFKCKKCAKRGKSEIPHSASGPFGSLTKISDDHKRLTGCNSDSFLLLEKHS